MSTIIPERGNLRLASVSCQTSAETGEGEVIIDIPSEGRMIAGGFGAFDNPAHGDKAIGVDVLMPDGVTVVDSFIDPLVPEANRGWFFLSGVLQIHALTNLRLLPGGLKLRFKVKKASNVVDTFRCNLQWGKP